MSVYWPRDSLFPLEIVLSEPNSSTLLFFFFIFLIFPLVFLFETGICTISFCPQFSTCGPCTFPALSSFLTWYQFLSFPERRSILDKIFFFSGSQLHIIGRNSKIILWKLFKRNIFKINGVLEMRPSPLKIYWNSD